MSCLQWCQNVGMCCSGRPKMCFMDQHGVRMAFALGLLSCAKKKQCYCMCACVCGIPHAAVVLREVACVERMGAITFP